MTPPFTKKRINLADLSRVKGLLKERKLNTVCESALCPNIGECFCRGVATFLIAGKTCTRACSFCAVDKGKPLPLDPEEPSRIAEAVRSLGLTYVVVTSVTRDDLPDGGAAHFAGTTEAIRSIAPGASVEVLVPDFGGDPASAQKVFRARPDVFAHNLETVPSLYAAVRSTADYARSLALLHRAKQAGLTTKSGIMLGLGEKEKEVLAVMDDLRKTSCDILTLGQYLAPTKDHYPVREFIPDDAFEKYRRIALDKGFTRCASAPYVRSSYLADALFSGA